MTFGDHRKLPASDLGLKAPRTCTNPCGLFLLLIFWVGMGAVAVVSYKNGNLMRLYRGVDYLGNICGASNSQYGNYTFSNSFGQNVLENSIATPWGQRTFLWYPVTFSNGKFTLTEARTQGICLTKCPAANTLVGLYKESTDSSMNLPYYVLFDSTPQFGRCIPDMSSFLCDTNSVCNKLKTSTNATLDQVYDSLENGFNDVRQHWWVILLSVFIAIVISFFWMFVMRRVVKPMVVVTMVIVVVGLGVGGYLLFKEHQNLSDSQPSSAKYFLYGAIAMWIVDFLLICVILYSGSNIMVACDIIEEATKIPITIPTTMFAPIAASVALIPFAVFFLFTSATIYTCSDTLHLNVTLPQYNSSNPLSVNFTSLAAKQIELPNWRIGAELFNLFMFLWTAGFIHAILFQTIAFCAVFWYWSVPGDDKKPEAGVSAAFGLVMKNHLGSLAIGSLIIAIISMARILLCFLEKHLDKYKDKSDALKCCLYCAECLLACFHRVVKFVNKNAYIVQAMTGEGFLDSAKHALSLLLNNAVSVAAVSVIGEWVCMFGKIFITSIVTIIAYYILKGEQNNFMVTLIIVVIVTYFITCVFINVFHVCIDTVLLSYCYDLGEHDGQGKPYFFPSDLAKHVNKAKERMKAVEDANVVPLNQKQL